VAATKPKKKKKFGWGGARPGAGRKPKGEKAGSPHRKRPRIPPNEPVTITMEMIRDLPVKAVKDAIAASREIERPGLTFRRVNLRGHMLHLVVVPKHRRALFRGMQGFQISAAKHVNSALGRTGTIFVDRYRIL
jgi:hypothetical protein